MDKPYQFKKTWWRGVISDAGFGVNLKPPHEIEYREGEKAMSVYMDMLVGDPAIDVDSISIRSWEPPFGGEAISPEKKQQILERICAALEFSGLTYVIR
jgi:Immunity protein 74